MLCPQYSLLSALHAASLHPHTQRSIKSVGQADCGAGLYSTVLLNGSPVYEWRLFTWEEYNWGKFTDKLTFPGSMSGGIKAPAFEFWSATLYTWHPRTSSESGAQRAQRSLASWEFHFLHWSTAGPLHSSESTHCHRIYSHTLQASYSLIQRTTHPRLC